LKIILVIFILLCGLLGFGQSISRSVISSGGGTVTTGNIMLSYNLGEPVADLLVNTTNILTLGFMQVDTDPGIEAATINITQQLVVFPNPTITGVTKLDFKEIPDGSYQVEILDAIGHVLYTKTVAYAKNNNLNLDLNVTNFKGGTYYIRVKNGKAQGQVKLVKL
jgi:hypothetical protein